MKQYVDRCLCGYFVTTEEIKTKRCPECDANISNLTESWDNWEKMQIEKDKKIRDDIL